MATLKGFLSVEVHILLTMKGVPNRQHWQRLDVYEEGSECWGRVKKREWKGWKKPCFRVFFESFIGSCLQLELITESTVIHH